MQEFITQAVIIARNIWRFRWYAMLIAWVACIIGWAIVFKMPDQYESRARIFIDSDSMLKPLLRGLAVESTDFRQQLGAMTRQLLSRPNLEKVVRMVDLDIEAQTPRDQEVVLKKLQENISLSAVGSQSGGPPNIYEISSIGDDANTAKDIVQALLTIFLETAIGESREDTGVAQEFLEKQINEYEQKLVSAENRLMKFKRDNMGVLPGQGGNIFQRLQTIRTELSQVELELLEATNRRNEIQRQIESVKNSKQPLIPPGVTPQRSPLEMRIITLQQRLDDLQMRYTRDHPDVRETIATLSMLQKQKEEQDKTSTLNNGDLSQSNPVYQQLKISITEVEAEIAALQVRQQEYQKRLVKLQEDVKVLPEIEAELQRLDRDYAINKEHYNELVKRRESARLAEDAGQTGEEVKFRVIDPPRTPLAPVGPNRPLLTTAVLAAAVGAGLGLAFLLSQIRPVFFDRRSIQETLQLPVFGVVARVWTPKLLWKRRSQFAAYLLFGIILIIAYGSVVYMNMKGVDATTWIIDRTL